MTGGQPLLQSTWRRGPLPYLSSAVADVSQPDCAPLPRLPMHEVGVMFATTFPSPPFSLLARVACRTSMRRLRNAADHHGACGGRDCRNAGVGAMGAATGPGVGPK